MHVAPGYSCPVESAWVWSVRRSGSGSGRGTLRIPRASGYARGTENTAVNFSDLIP